jgi:hypothetical protein
MRNALKSARSTAISTPSGPAESVNLACPHAGFPAYCIAQYIARVSARNLLHVLCRTGVRLQLGWMGLYLLGGGC